MKNMRKNSLELHPAQKNKKKIIGITSGKQKPGKQKKKSLELHPAHKKKKKKKIHYI